MKILIVDDEKDIREMIDEFFTDMLPKVSLHFAESGHRALEIIREINFDAIITDHYMPKMTGLEFISKLKEDGKIPKLVMFFTSRNDDGFKKEVSSLGAELTIKPTVTDLVQSLKKHLD